MFLVTLAHGVRPASAQPPAPILRGRGLEIVDDQGRVRASITVMPATSTTGPDRGDDLILELAERTARSRRPKFERVLKKVRELGHTPVPGDER